jgi:hypothetical protein
VDPQEQGASTPRRVLSRELLVFAGFAGLTILMTWPWAAWIRDAASDLDDPCNSAWILWWDWHQTFHDPLNLFHGNIFYPLKYALAFSEHDYGIAMLFFPLFWAGVRPFTMQGIATLFGFALSGYGAFRLTRTLTGSAGAVWLAGIAFAFIPYRFGQTAHLTYVWAVWMPLVLEALVLLLRVRSPKRAAWLGVAFTMNGLSCIHWFVLTLVPLLATGVFLAYRDRIERDRALWRRGAIALGVSAIVLMPFFIPYKRAADLYGMTRSTGEAAFYSALPKDWLQMHGWNRLWKGYAEWPPPPERLLFPGLLVLLLSFAAIKLSPSEKEGSPAESGRAPRRRLLATLDAIAILAGTIAVFAYAPKHIRISIAGHEIFHVTESSSALAVLALAVVIRWCLEYPRFLSFPVGSNLPESLRRVRRPQPVVVGLLWAALGFLGSLGMNTPYHRTLFFIPLFQSIRVPVRSAMVAYLGLAVLAGVGALRLAARVRRPAAVFALLGALLLFEDRAAPLPLVHGEVDPDEVTLRLKDTPMKGGLVVLPSGTPERGNYNATLRAADHGKPLVNATSGFSSPYVDTIEVLSAMRPIPLDLLDDLEAIPTSYVLVHESWLSSEEKAAMHAFLARGLAWGRLRFIRRFDAERANDLYAVVKNEPQAKAEQPVPWEKDGR